MVPPKGQIYTIDIKGCICIIGKASIRYEANVEVEGQLGKKIRGVPALCIM
ncbi:MAG: hypothetical protein ABFD07_09445 [Methanobacterium sp.]